MTNKKIGMIVYSNPDYYPPTVNAVHLLSEHFDITLIGRNQETSYWKYPSNVTVHRLGTYSSVGDREQISASAKLWEYINFIAQARHLLKDMSLIYAYDGWAYNAAYLCQLFPPKLVPLIYHSHEISDRLSSLSSLSGWIQRAERKLVHRAKIIVFPDKDRAAFFQQVTKINQQPLIVPNFPRKDFFKLFSEWENLIPNRFVTAQILLQGAISPNTSMSEIIESMAFSGNYIQVKFIGRLTQEDQKLMLEVANRENVTERLIYISPVSYNELPSHTWAASVGLCLYKNIGLNCQANVTATNKIYEYAACGLPVIVSDFPNYREYLSSESWVRFANPEDPQSIAEAIKDILNDFENYKSMCLAARQAFEEKFNYEAVFSPLLSEINELVEQHQ